MYAYQLKYPEHILFGDGVRSRLPEWLRAEDRILLLTGSLRRQPGRLAQFESLLADRLVAHAVVSGGEPTVQRVDELLTAARSQRIDTVVAIGGGSVLDAGKTVAALLFGDGPAADYFYRRRPMPAGGARLFTLPTTAGTGAEITSNAVLIDESNHLKQSIRHESMFATAALVDPQLTWSCPPDVTAASGMDALTQAIESYLSNKANRATRPLAAEAARLLLRRLPQLIAAPDDADARRDTAEAAMLGAMAFSASGLGAVHGLAHPIGSLLHLPHGVCCAVLLPAIMRWNLPQCRAELEELSRYCHCGDAEALIAAVGQMNRDFGLPDSFRPAGLQAGNFDFIVKNCRSGSMSCNPRPLTDADVRTLLKELS
ncbi:iron-containing alcohol dehydrogenase [Victivallis sp. Marseille-Q1083]|uniref:iron-containing alcohol dehydrogenase n=1 Tax=Victivallis sp. Marseille-Q1083 TaxID=2717288 RepID=UPI00158F5413|nr:iron-containing alcohol dehydrogenase [Victivallis sp. Marseille-Q1083]